MRLFKPAPVPTGTPPLSADVKANIVSQVLFSWCWSTLKVYVSLQPAVLHFPPFWLRLHFVLRFVCLTHVSIFYAFMTSGVSIFVSGYSRPLEKEGGLARSFLRGTLARSTPI